MLAHPGRELPKPARGKRRRTQRMARFPRTAGSSAEVLVPNVTNSASATWSRL